MQINYCYYFILLFCQVLRLRRYERISTEIAVFAPKGSAWPKISDRRGRPINHSFCHKTRINDLSSCIKIWAQVSFVLSQITRLTDRRTDSFIVTRPPCIQCSAVLKTSIHSGAINVKKTYPYRQTDACGQPDCLMFQSHILTEKSFTQFNTTLIIFL